MGQLWICRGIGTSVGCCVCELNSYYSIGSLEKPGRNTIELKNEVWSPGLDSGNKKSISVQTSEIWRKAGVQMVGRRSGSLEEGIAAL